MHFFFKFYTKFPFNSYITIRILELKKKKKKHKESCIIHFRERREKACLGIFIFLGGSSTSKRRFSCLYIDFLDFFFSLDKF